MGLKLDEIKALMSEMQRYGMTELKWHGSDGDLELSRAVPVVVEAVEGVSSPASEARLSQPSQLAEPDRTAEGEEPEGQMIYSPVVGVFYAASAPDAEPFVSVGSTVKKGDVICIIEAMKLMNEVLAETSGTIKDILVSNGEKVEYGQPLMRLV